MTSLLLTTTVRADSVCEAALAVVQLDTHVFEIDRIRVEFRNRTESTFGVLELREATFAMSLVWRRHRRDATDLTVDIFEVIPFAERAQGAYNLVSDRIELSTHWLLVVAHEMTHRVQKFRGDTLPDNHDLAVMDPTGYATHPAEVEAHLESLHVAKFMYPAASGAVFVGERRFEVPARSWYAER